MPARPTALVVALVGALTALGLLAGCAVGPSQRPAVATVATGAETPAGTPTPDVPAPPASPLPPLLPATPAVRFDDCTATASAALGGPVAFGGRDLRLGCAAVPIAGTETLPSGTVGVLRVTLGPAPSTPTVPLAVLSDPVTGGGAAQAVRLAASAPASLLSGAALYGIDVRGSGTSEAVDCVNPATRAAFDDVDPAAGDPLALAGVARSAQDAARTCTLSLEDAVTGYRSGSAASDLEEVRGALGASRLNVLGLGLGAGVAAAWSERFPAGVGRVVLDGLPDPTAPALLRADQRLAAARGALTAFATDCESRPGCPLGTDPASAVAGIESALRAAPLSGPDGRSVGPGTLVTALVDGLADPSSWSVTAGAVAAAGRGDPGPLLARVDAVEADGGGYDLTLMTTCNDSSERLTVDQVATAAARARTADPVFGSWFAQRTLACSSWPVPTDPLPAPTAAGAPALLLASAADPVTPADGTARVAAQLQGATLVAWLGAGHGSFPQTPCINAAVEGFLSRAAIPRAGTVCPP